MLVCIMDLEQYDTNCKVLVFHSARAFSTLCPFRVQLLAEQHTIRVDCILPNRVTSGTAGCNTGSDSIYRDSPRLKDNILCDGARQYILSNLFGESVDCTLWVSRR